MIASLCHRPPGRFLRRWLPVMTGQHLFLFQCSKIPGVGWREAGGLTSAELQIIFFAWIGSTLSSHPQIDRSSQWRGLDSPSHSRGRGEGLDTRGQESGRSEDVAMAADLRASLWELNQAASVWRPRLGTPLALRIASGTPQGQTRSPPGSLHSLVCDFPSPSPAPQSLQTQL